MVTVVVCPSGADVSSSTLRFLATRLRQRRRTLDTRWRRRLSTGRQALLTLAPLRVGHTYAQLAAGFGVSTSTVYRYPTEAVALFADLAPALAEAARAASTKAFVPLDGTLLPIDRSSRARRRDIDMVPPLNPSTSGRAPPSPAHPSAQPNPAAPAPAAPAPAASRWPLRHY